MLCSQLLCPPVPSTNISCYTALPSNIALEVSMKKTLVPSAMHSSSPLLGNCNRSQPLAALPLLIRLSPSPFLALQHYSGFRLSCLCRCHLLQFWFLFLLRSSLLTLKEANGTVSLEWIKNQESNFQLRAKELIGDESKERVLKRLYRKLSAEPYDNGVEKNVSSI